jgi:hypothetical protein
LFLTEKERLTLADKSSDPSATYISSDWADAWQRESLRRNESSGAATDHGLPLQIVRTVGNLPVPPSGQPGMFSGAGVLEGLYRGAGFRDVGIHAASLRRKYGSLQDTIQGMKGTMAIPKDLMAKLSEADQARAWEQIEKAMSQFVGPSGFDAPGEALIGVGTK